MKQKERFQRIRKAFKKIIEDGKEGAFVIFTNPETDKFVQFAYEFEEKVFVCDIPLAELSKSEEAKIRLLFGEYCNKDVETGEKISYQEVFELDVINAMTKLTEQIFTNVFGLPETYRIECDLRME